MKKTKQMGVLVLVIAFLGSVILLNLISSGNFYRLDLTQDRKFTLSSASKETVKNLDDVLTISAYFTNGLPVPYSTYGRYVKDLLEEYRASSNGKFSFEIMDPIEEETTADKQKKKEIARDIFGRIMRESTSVEKELEELGVQPVEIRVFEDDQQQTKRAYLGIVIRYQGKHEVIPVVQDLANLEKDMTGIMRKLLRQKTPVVAILKNSQSEISTFRNLLSQNMAVRDLEPSPDLEIGEDVDALVVVGSNRVNSSILKTINAFVRSGRSVAFLVDKVEVDPKTFSPRSEPNKDKDANLYSLLESYGVLTGEDMVADVECASLTFREQRANMVVHRPVKYPFIPEVMNVDQENVVTRGLLGLLFPFASSILVNDVENIKTSVLARSSKNSWLENFPQDLSPRRDWRAESVDVSGPYPVLVQLIGRFPDHFSTDGSVMSEEKNPESRILVAGTSAIVWDDFFGGPNQVLALNMVDWMLADSSLLAMRTRAFADAPLKSDIADGTRAAVKYGNVVGVPLVLVLYGLARWRRRENRRKSVHIG